jgi:hypothetical protein
MRIAGPRIKHYRVVIMRMALPLLALYLSTPALAAPTLRIDHDRRVDLFEVRVVAPDGAITWTCRKEPPSGPVDTPVTCEATPEWYRGPGKYVAMVMIGGASESLETKEFVVTGEEESISWTMPHGQMKSQVRGGMHLRFTVPAGSLREASFTNRHETPVWGSLGGSGIRFERWENGSWQRTDHYGTYVGNEMVAPGETRRILLNEGAITNFEPGRYRALITVRLTDPDRMQTESPLIQQIEVASEPYDLPPEGKPQACLYDEKTSIPRLADGPFRSLHKTSVGILLLKTSGELLRVDDDSMKVIATLPAGSRLQRGSTEDMLLVIGPQLMFSEDGGRTFKPIGHVASRPDDQFLFAGEKLFRFSIHGDMAWISRTGEVTEMKPPLTANWRAAAFRDEKHGALIGDCSVLIETDDGGSTWKATATPWPFMLWMSWTDSELSLSGPRGRWTRLDGQASFSKTEKVAPSTKPSQRITYRSQGSARAEKLTFDLEIFQRDAQGKESTQNIHFEDPPFRRPTGMVVASDGSLYLLTTPAGLFRHRDGALKVMLSTDALEKYPAEQRAYREQIRRNEELRKQRGARAP